MSKPSSPALQSGNSLATGLLRCFLINEGSGSTLNDLSGNTGTALTTRSTSGSTATTAAPTWATDAGALVGGPYITLSQASKNDAIGADTGLPTGLAARTMAVLFRKTTHSSGYTDFLLSYGTNGNSSLSIGLATPQAGVLNIQPLWGTTISAGFGGQTDLVDGNWHLGHLVLDGSSNLSMYLDGALIQTYHYSGGALSTPANSQTLATTTALSGNLYLGQLGGTGGSGPAASNGLYYGGDLAGSWVWNRALSPSDISNHYSDPWQMVRPTGAPTSYTLTPPGTASGTVNVASGAFTVAATGTMAAPAVVTPACTPGTGTFTPSTVTLTGANPSQTFTFTPTSTGSGGASQADAIGVTNNQSLTNPSSVTYTSIPVVPGAPSGLAVAAGNAQNTLTWTAPGTGGAVQSYSVFRGTTAGGESGTALATAVSASSYTDSTAANGTAYYYTVKAVNAGGSSAASNEASGTPSIGPAVSPASATIPQGGTQALVASNFTGGAVTWASSNPAVVTVNSSGLVTEVGPGSATITATGVANTGQSARCAATVPQVAISVSPTAVSLGSAGTATIGATVTGAVNAGVTWASSSPTVATVDGSGRVTAVGPGSATITATASADGTKSASCAATVLNMMTTSLAFGLSPTATSATMIFYRADGSVYTPSGTPTIVAAGTTGLFIGTAQLPMGIWILVVATDNTGAMPDSQVWMGYPPAATDASGRTQVQVGTSPGQLSVAAGKVAATVAGGDGVDASAVKATIGAAGAGLTAITLASAQSFDLTGNITGNLSGSVGSATTIADKAGYSLATAPATPSAIATAVVAGMATAQVGSVASVVQVGSYAPGQDPATLLYAGAFPASPAAHTSGSVLKQLDGMITGGSFNGAALANMTAASTVSLSPAGLDGIAIEPGVNARQALSIVFAACGGVVSGAGTGSIVIKGGNAATTRINATTDSNGNRTAVTLALPA